MTPDEAQFFVRELEQGVRSSDDPTVYEVDPLKPSTVIKRVAVARHFYDALIWVGLVAENPFDSTKVAADPEKPEDKRHAYALEDVRLLLHAARRLDDRTTLLTVLLTVLAGLRAHELTELRWDQLDFEAGLIKVIGKGEKPRYTPLADLVAAELIAYRRSRDDTCPYVLVRNYRGLGPYTDQALRYRLQQLCKQTINLRTGRPVSYKALHSFRHTFGTEMQKLVSLLDLQLILGHSDVKTTSIYGLSTSERAATRALGTRNARSDSELLKHKEEGVNAIGRVIEGDRR